MFFYKQKFFKKSFISLFAFASIFVCLMNPSDVMAVNGDILPNVAKTHNIEDENVQSGDIISYNNEINTYTLSKSVSSKRMFGVVAENPLLVFEYDEEGVPVLKSGALKVNVLLKEGEEIKQGDLITSSSFPGKGKSVGSEDFYVLGASKENVSFDSSIAPVMSYEGEDIKVSKVGVDVDIGPRPETSFHTQTDGAGESNETTSTKIIQYAIARYFIWAERRFNSSLY